jgi:lipid-binding SYLF domain-containing protein
VTTKASIAGIMDIVKFGRQAATAFLVLLATGCNRAPNSPAEQRTGDREHAVERLDESTAVVRAMLESDEIPRAKRERARCVVVIPSLLSGGLVVGVKSGNGVVTCRTPPGWSPPAFVTVTGGSAGLQAGVESADVVMLVMSDRAVGQLFRSSFELGADASAAAGPVGRDRQASTDEKLTAEILSYARSRGLFAGVQLNGAVMKQDLGPAVALYGGSPDVHAILSGQVGAPREASAFADELRKAFPLPHADGSAVTEPQPH